MDKSATQGIVLTVQQMGTIIKVLEIATDWHAPLYYDIEEPRGWDGLGEPDAEEPEWVSIYKLLDKLRATIAPAEGFQCSR